MPKNNPTPVRFDEVCNAIIDDLAKRTGMTKSEIIRRAGRLALPKFASGEVDISLVTAPKPAPAK